MGVLWGHYEYNLRLSGRLHGKIGNSCVGWRGKGAYTLTGARLLKVGEAELGRFCSFMISLKNPEVSALRAWSLLRFYYYFFFLLAILGILYVELESVYNATCFHLLNDLCSLL